VAQLLILTSAPNPTAPRTPGATSSVSDAAGPGAEVLPSLALLSHRVRQIPAEPASLVNAPSCDLIFVDARRDLASAKSLCKILTTTGVTVPLVLVLTEGGLTAVSADWGVSDVVLDSAGPAELDARIRLAIGRQTQEHSQSKIQASGITIDEASYSAKAHGRQLDLTFKEFELLRFFATHPTRVFTREQLLSEVWGYDYFGGTRTVDVHVRRLRAKLGDLESLIGTVRNVGYRLNVYEEENDRLPTSVRP
jgi:DNA-binding response OmpR family regulator